MGNPNVGKSTLLNALLEQRLSIVSPKPQTTRHRILGVLSKENYQLIFSDTPGMLKPVYKLQEAMMESVRGAMSDADVCVVVSDVFGEPLHDERVLEKLQLTDRPIVVVINKIDLVQSVPTNCSDPEQLTSVAKMRRPRGNSSEDEYSAPRTFEQLVELWGRRLPRARVLGLSAANNYKVEELLDELASLVPRGPKYFPEDTLTNRDERFFAAEIVREALFLCYKDEVPYSCEVLIQSFQDKSPGLSVIEAFVVVDKDSLKALLIGKGGEKLKELGTKARGRLEEFLGRRVYLSLRVKVDPDWRRNQEALVRFGYVESDFG